MLLSSSGGELPQNAVRYEVLNLHMPASVAPSVGQRPRHGYWTRRIAPAAETFTRNRVYALSLILDRPISGIFLVCFSLNSGGTEFCSPESGTGRNLSPNAGNKNRAASSGIRAA
jgi:hypothetical protein